MNNEVYLIEGYHLSPPKSTNGDLVPRTWGGGKEGAIPRMDGGDNRHRTERVGRKEIFTFICSKLDWVYP